MIWIARLLCPQGHVIAAGATEADPDESTADLALNFLDHLRDHMPEIDCNPRCKYSVNLRTMCRNLNVQIENTPFQTTDEAAALIAAEARQIRKAELVAEFVYRSRN